MTLTSDPTATRPLKYSHRLKSRFGTYRYVIIIIKVTMITKVSHTQSLDTAESAG